MAAAEAMESKSFKQGVEGIMRKKDSTFRVLPSLLTTGRERERGMRSCVPLDCSEVGEVTEEGRVLLTLPQSADSGFKCSSGSMGKDEVLLMRGVNILERDQDLEMDTFSCGTVAEEPKSISVAFSISRLELWDMKFSLGNKFLMDDLPLWRGPGDPFTLGSEGLGVTRKFTFFAIGVGVKSFLI